ncbi:hypothetical protein V6N13_114345 [Hibiscus sabdariffa]
MERLAQENQKAIDVGFSVVREDVRLNVNWSFGHGVDIAFWLDSWIGDMGPLVQYVSHDIVDSLPNTSVTNMTYVNGDWNWVSLQALVIVHRRTRSNTLPTVGVCRWSPTEMDWVKFNMVGSRRDGDGFASCWGVVRNHNGDWLGGFAKFIGIFAWDLWCRRIVLEIDCLEALKLLHMDLHSIDH